MARPSLTALSPRMSSATRLRSVWSRQSSPGTVLIHFPLFSPGAWAEYNMPDQQGKPSEGTWLAQGTPEPAFVQPLQKKRQCSSHCFMGNGSPATAPTWVTDWTNKKRWVDGEDYQQLVRKIGGRCGS
jgi:hypothetical protein